MTSMHALVAYGVGEPADMLRLETRPVHEPGRGQVRIRVQAAPIHPTDLHILRGRYGFAPELPAVLGHESVGIVDKLGTGVDGVAVGQRVTFMIAVGNVPISTPAEFLKVTDDQAHMVVAIQQSLRGPSSSRRRRRRDHLTERPTAARHLVPR